MISGNSRLPTFKEMSLADTVVTATGVTRSLATSITLEETTTSSVQSLTMSQFLVVLVALPQVMQ